MRQRALAATLCTGLLLPMAGAADALPPSLCGAQEGLVFACSVGGGKHLSLCGVPPATLQYRFGTAARTELAFPADAADGVRRLRLAHYQRAQVERTEINFSIGDIDYTVFDDTRGGRRRAGVAVQREGQPEQQLPCRGRISGALLPLKPHLPCDAESALQGGSCR